MVYRPDPGGESSFQSFAYHLEPDAISKEPCGFRKRYRTKVVAKGLGREWIYGREEIVTSSCMALMVGTAHVSGVMESFPYLLPVGVRRGDSIYGIVGLIFSSGHTVVWRTYWAMRLWHVLTGTLFVCECMPPHRRGDDAAAAKEVMKSRATS